MGKGVLKIVNSLLFYDDTNYGNESKTSTSVGVGRDWLYLSPNLNQHP